jgi:hypothetical protein
MEIPVTTYFLTLRGTAEPFEGLQTMLRFVANEAGPQVKHHDVWYDASIAFFNERDDIFGASLKRSIELGAINISNTMEAIVRDDAEARFVLGGYSLGCLVINRWLDNMDVPLFKNRTLRIVHIANPARPMGDSYLRQNVTGYGIARTSVVHHIPQTFNLANPRDAITSLHPKSPLRNIVPWLYGLDINQPDDWFWEIMRRAQEGTLREQSANIFSAQWREAVARMPDDLYGYAFGGQHTIAYGHTEWQGRNAIQVAGELVRTA